PNAAINAQQVAARKCQMQQGQEVLVPTYRDPVFGNAAKAFQNAVVERLVNLGPGVNWTRRLVRTAGEIFTQRLNLQTVDADNAKTFIDEKVRQRVSGRPHADNEHVLPIVRKGIRAADVQRIPSREEAVNLDAPWKFQ